MTQAAHTNQTPTLGDVANGAAITTGVRFTVATALIVAKIAFWVPVTNTGTYTVALYRTDTDDDPNGTGTGTLLSSVSVDSSAVTAGGWAEISITAQNLTTGVIYTAARHATSGRYVATAGAFTGTAIAGNGITLLASGSDPNPPGLGSLLNGVFHEGAALAYPNSSFGQADYFVDVVIGEPEESEDTAASSLSAVAARFTSSAAVTTTGHASTSSVAALARSTSGVGEG